MSTASPASGSPAFCMITTRRRPSSLTRRWIVPGENHNTEPAASRSRANPAALRVCTSPRPAVTTYASVETVCRCGVPPWTPSAHSQS
ncbi:hypothetical protein [Nonomuraea sp. MG754425]|uniref:hypothetical protein n=1 Tax=Nonomuraea sp. MG754425 TaxID=2570319 RepID=UPI0034D7A530